MPELIYPPAKGTALFRVQSKKRLAEILVAKPATLKKLTNGNELYNCWSAPKKNGGFRDIEAPFDQLKIVQKRIATLLQAIETPDFLMAPVKTRSYVTNAAQHIGSRSFCLLDIEDFFPSCTKKKVYWFFNTCMGCSPDVAAILAEITTRYDRLPQGSPCSPILAFFAYVDMWLEISKVCELADNKVTVYADDITISGLNVLGEDIWKIKQILHRHGHKFQIEKERAIVDRKVEITGVIVSKSSILLPNRQHKKMRETQLELTSAKSKDDKNRLKMALRGRVAQANQIVSNG